MNEPVSAIDGRECAVVGLWRKGHLSPGTIVIYLQWVRRFRAYCERRKIVEIEHLTAAGVRRFSRSYIGPRLKRRGSAQSSRDVARNALHAWACALQALGTVLPQSAVGKAAAYTLNMWPKLRRCFDYAEVELSNNLAENSMRGVALGRKNWLHVGSVKSGPKGAAILSIIESCRRLGVPAKDYLLAVLPGLDHRMVSDVAQITPASWSGAHN